MDEWTADRSGLRSCLRQYMGNGQWAMGNGRQAFTSSVFQQVTATPTIRD